MGFALNCGVKLAKHELLLVTQCDVVPLEGLLQSCVNLASKDPYSIATPTKVYDDDGKAGSDLLSEQHLNKLKLNRASDSSPFKSHPDMPFFLCMHKERYMEIGGCDEDFVGYASEDNDLMNRLIASGCKYVRASQSAVHLHHGRPDWETVLSSVKFKYNRELMVTRSWKLVRNEGREWGHVIQPDQPMSERPLHLVLWVTSCCNLKCPLCNQTTAREVSPGYKMSRAELDHFINSSVERGIKYKTIELSGGGEVSIWPEFEYALKALRDSGVAEELSFITNGANAERVTDLAFTYCPCYHVSLQQATPEQVNIHRSKGVRVFWVNGPHLPSPQKLVDGSLPCSCQLHTDRWGFLVNQLLYYSGNVYRCCPANMHYTFFIDGLEKGYCVPFDSDFVTWARGKTLDCNLCAICLCNNKVFDRMKIL